MSEFLRIKDVLNVVDAGFVSGDELVKSYNYIVSKVLEGFQLDVCDRQRFIKLAKVVAEMEKKKSANSNEQRLQIRPSVIVHSKSCCAGKDYGRSRAVNETLSNPQPSTSKAGPSHCTPDAIKKIDQSGKGAHFIYFDLLQEGVKQIKKFNTEAKVLNFKFREVEIVDPISWLKNAIEEILAYAISGAAPTDRIGMVLTNTNFPEKPVGISFRRPDQLSAKVVMATLEKVLQSNAAFFSRDEMRLQVHRIALPLGYGRVKLTGVSFEEFCRRRQGVIQVSNYDNHCLARALAIAIAWANKDANLDLMKWGHPILETATTELCAAAEVDLHNGGGADEIQQFQQHLQRYTIVVYNNRLGTSTYYEGPRGDGRITLNLLLENGHYSAITSLTSAFACSYFCEICKARTTSSRAHKNCKCICIACHKNPPCKKSVPVKTCANCNRDFYGEGCFTRHIAKLCGTLKRCANCLTTAWITKKPHQCGIRYCSVCGTAKPVRHFCYMPTNNSFKKLPEKFIFVFYDFECTQDTRFSNQNNVFSHEPNLCVAQHVCNACIFNFSSDVDCAICGKRQHIFEKDPVNSLLDYLRRLLNEKIKVYALAHNMKGYDGPFILRAILKNSKSWNPRIITNGTKLMSISCNGDLKFIDSLNFIPVALNKMPQTFGFQGSKGYFPHLFNTSDNRDYAGVIPGIEYYMADEMPIKAREDFLGWYADESGKNTVFVMRDELIKYCVQDVAILRQGCTEFWRQYVEKNNVDPFRECNTIAGCCSLVYRRNFLVDQTIGIIPSSGYRLGENQSGIALKWLLWVGYSEKITIKHAGNGREVRLKEGILVDGYCEDENLVLQFHGCYYHTCPRCYPDLLTLTHSKQKIDMLARRERTLATSARIKSLGYNLREIWECEFREFLKLNTNAQAFTSRDTINAKMPLNPRDSFFGGRTNAIKLYHRANPDEDEKIRYFDVCSLYPYVNKYSKYPIGHPDIHVGHDNCKNLSMNTLEGLIKCAVLPPTQLFHPVLPLKMHGKLMFVLCRTCAENLNEGSCHHTVDDRKFVGTYIADELRKALQLGYRVLEFYEIWEYRVVQYDKATKTGGLFGKYVDNFLKAKQECSGWPSWCINEQAKEQYINEYYEKEGVRLDKNKIECNPGMRYIAKLNLNCYWGKLGQRENLMQTSIIDDPGELYNKLTDPSVQAHSMHIVDEDVLLLHWDRPEGGFTPLTTVNVVLASYTTANARLELYKYLERLGSRVLYFDTDSVIFTEKPGEWIPPIGDFLGEMTDEIGNGNYITEFVSGGPKNYAFKVFSPNTDDESTVVKVKGISLNFKNSQKINFEAIKDIVVNGGPDVYVETDRKIARTSTYTVLSKPEKKIYRMKYTKRRRVDSYETLPFGYRE